MPLSLALNSTFVNRQYAPFSSLLVVIGFILTCSTFGFGQTILVGWNFEDKNATADFGITVNTSCQITSSSPSTVNYVTGSGGTGSFSTNNINWDNGLNLKFWQISFSSQGYKNLKITSKQYSSNTGPRDFKIQYSLDGINWIDTGILISVAANFTKGVVNEIEIPSPCENQSLVYLRWTMNSNIAVNGSLVGASGSNRMDDLQVKGCLIPLLTSLLNITCCSGTSAYYFPEGTGNSYQWQRFNTAGIKESANSGSGLIDEILTNTTNMPVDVQYQFLIENSGCTNNQNVTLTVNPTPDLAVSPEALTVCPTKDTLQITFSDSKQIPETSFYWEWTGRNQESLTVSPANGQVSPIKITIDNFLPAQQTETSLYLTGISPLGCTKSQEIIIYSGDNSPPIFSGQITDRSFCVEDISDATSNGADDILEPRPEYYLFVPNDHALDLNSDFFSDNCSTTDELILHWQIELYENPSLISGIGQPSAILSPIAFPGNGLTQVNHIITYWLEDKYGNITPLELRSIVTITIKPRPPIVQNF